VLETAKENMTPDEWGYLIEGKAAQKDILSPEGKVMEKAGAVRDGARSTSAWGMSPAGTR
jgi:putative spermidine/putrescine transport system substrate-binding protein